MAKNFRDTLNERMKDPEFRAEWEAQEPERQIAWALIEGRESRDLTQKQLAEITSIDQGDISKLGGEAIGGEAVEADVEDREVRREVVLVTDVNRHFCLACCLSAAVL